MSCYGFFFEKKKPICKRKRLQMGLAIKANNVWIGVERNHTLIR